MKLCIISPVAGLEEFASLSDCHLLLAQIKNPKYRSFYWNRRQHHEDTILLDNGAYEGEQVKVEDLIEASHYYFPHYNCLLDIPGKGKETFTRSITSMLQMTRRVTGSFLAIPQGQSRKEVQDMLDIYLDIEEVKAIGISKLLRPMVENEISTLGGQHYRARLAHSIKWRRPDMYIHALGMWDGDIYEYNNCADSGCINSLDTSAAVWRGIHRYSLDKAVDKAGWKESGTSVDFNYDEPITEEQRYYIRHNLEVLGVRT